MKGKLLNGRTALMASSGPWPGGADVICTLLGAGANVLFRNAEGETALTVAYRGQGNEVVSILEKAAAAKSPARRRAKQ